MTSSKGFLTCLKSSLKRCWWRMPLRLILVCRTIRSWSRNWTCVFMSWVSLKRRSSKIYARVRSVKSSLKSRWMVLNKTVQSWKKGSPSLRVRRPSQTTPTMISYRKSLLSSRKTPPCKQSWKWCSQDQSTSWLAEGRIEATLLLRSLWKTFRRAKRKTISEHSLLLLLVRHASPWEWFQFQ